MGMKWLLHDNELQRDVPHIESNLWMVTKLYLQELEIYLL